MGDWDVLPDMDHTENATKPSSDISKCDGFSEEKDINKPTMWTWKRKNTINKLFPLAFIKVK